MTFVPRVGDYVKFWSEASELEEYGHVHAVAHEIAFVRTEDAADEWEYCLHFSEMTLVEPVEDYWKSRALRAEQELEDEFKPRPRRHFVEGLVYL